jgi:hypothetical protein
MVGPFWPFLPFFAHVQDLLKIDGKNERTEIKEEGFAKVIRISAALEVLSLMVCRADADATC